MYSFDATMRESRGTSMGGEIGAWGLAPGPTAVSERGLEPPLVVATSAWPREALACQRFMLASDEAVFDSAAA